MTPPRALTQNCPREDCCITSQGASTTLAACVEAYDKHGAPIHRRNPNIVRIHYACETCGKKWDVARQAGQEDRITETELLSDE